MVFGRFFQSTGDHNEDRNFALEVVKTVGIGLTAIGLLFSVWEGLEERRLTQERLVTERFSKAVEQLGKYKDKDGQNEDITVRIGGIYALERIAKDSPKDYWTIIEVLTSYVRNNSSLPRELKQFPKDKQGWAQRREKQKNLPEVSIDIQTALIVIGRLEDPYFDQRNEIINLSFSNLRNATLIGYIIRKKHKDIDLTEFDGEFVAMKGIYLKNANLEGANLEDAKLERANLKNANLEGANLEDANLEYAKLKGANLKGANLKGANLEGANLEYANLKGANLENANLKGADLTPSQVKSACNLKQAIYKYDNSKNQKYIEDLNKDKASNLKEPIDCSRWEE